MKNWTNLDINDHIWLIDKHDELIGTTIYKKEEHGGALPTITYTFDIDDYKYKLVVRIDKDFDTVLYKKLVSNNKETNYDKYYVSPYKLALLEKYYFVLKEEIDKINQDIKKKSDILCKLNNRYGDYITLYNKEKEEIQDDII